MPRIPLVMNPARPNMKIMARPMTKGGVMMGRSENPCMRRLWRNRERSMTRAKTRPTAVDRTPTVKHMRRLFLRILQVLG